MLRDCLLSNKQILNGYNNHLEQYIYHNVGINIGGIVVLEQISMRKVDEYFEVGRWQQVSISKNKQHRG